MCICGYVGGKGWKGEGKVEGGKGMGEEGGGQGEVWRRYLRGIIVSLAGHVTLVPHFDQSSFCYNMYPIRTDSLLMCPGIPGISY